MRSTGYLVFLTLSLLLATPVAAQAQSGPLSVTFSQTPLFANSGIAPGDTVQRQITVANTGTAAEAVYLDTENVQLPASGTNLADVLKLTISDGTTEYFSGSFTDLFAATPVGLGTLTASQNKTFQLTASFDPTAGNAYQARTFGFDLVVGFAGGSSVSTASARGGSGGRTSLRIVGTQLVATSSNALTVGWRTNLPALSRLVCGAVGEGPYQLDPMDTQLGYPLATNETTGRERRHQQTLRNLAVGEYECVPAVRRSTSDEYTTGDPVRVSIGPAGLVAGAAVTAGETPVPTSPAGLVAGARKGVSTMLEEFQAWVQSREARAEAGNDDSPQPFTLDRVTEPQPLAAATASVDVNRSAIAFAVAGLLLVALLGWAVRRLLVR